MGRKKLLAVAIAAMSATALVSCGKKKEGSVEFEVRFMDSSSVLQTVKAKKGKTADGVVQPTKPGYEFKGWVDASGQSVDITNLKITEDTVLYAKFETIKYKVSFNSNGAGDVADMTYTTDRALSLPAPKKTGKIFAGWKLGDKNVYSLPKGLTADVSLEAQFRDPGIVTAVYKTVAGDYEAGSIANKTKGIYTIVSGEVRPRIATWTDPANEENKMTFARSYKNPVIKVTPKLDGKIEFYVQNGSGSAATQKVSVQEGTATAKEIEFSGVTKAIAPYGIGSPIVKVVIDATANQTYTIKYVSGTIDIYEVDFKADVPEEELSGVKLMETPKADVLEGSEYSGNDIRLIAQYGGEDGYEVELDKKDVIIDDKDVDYKIPGVYKANALFCQNAAEFDVNVYGATEFSVNKYTTVVENNGFNDIYITDRRAGLIVNKDGTNVFNPSNLSITVKATLGSNTKYFVLKDNISVSYGKLYIGQNEVTVDCMINGKKFTGSYYANYTEAAPYKDSNGNYVVTVDKLYEGKAGNVDGDKGNMFTTIQDALDFLEYADLGNSPKIMNVAAGMYREKVEIKLPNLTIVGAGVCKGTYTKDDNYNGTAFNAATIIEWDSLYGIPDESGFSQVTDSTATVAVRKEAVNCVFKNITLSNKWNCERVFDDNTQLLSQYGIYVGGKVNDHRALALIVQADKFQMDSCSLLGYQDTVEFMTGRQYVKNTYIAGNTDFIFGTNATTLFDSCEIHFIAKPSSSSKPVGYITAYKGANSDADTAIDYGFIFNHCNFTADEGVSTGSIAIGRPWGAFSQVTVLNSTLCAKIGKEVDVRYYSMSGVSPTDETVRYYEYNNTGDGAITASQAGVDILTAEEASKCVDYSVIYGKTNGKVTYEDSWTPTI